MNSWILLPVFIPAISGIFLLLASFREHLGKMEEGEDENRRLHLFVGVILIVSAVLALYAAWSGEKSLTLFYLTEKLPVYFHIDEISRIFITVTSIVWIAVGA